MNFSRNKLSVIIPTYNEERNLRACLQSVNWADEILVIDSFSTDQTVEIAKEFNATIIQHAYESHAAQRNRAIEKAQHHWILLLDADERATPELQQEITLLLQSQPKYLGYWIRRKNFYLGREIKYSGWGKDFVGRFFHRDSSHVEEYGFHGDLQVDGAKGKMNSCLLHHTYQDFDEIFDKVRTYAEGGAIQLYQNHKQANTFTIFFHSTWAFLFNYLFRLGFLDGVFGFLVCGQTAIYTFYKYAILWHFQQHPQTTKSIPIQQKSEPHE